LNYANYVFDAGDQKEFANEYSKAHMDLSLNSVPDWELRHIGSVCWLIQHDCDIKNIEEYHDRIIELYSKYTLNKQDNMVKVDLPTQRTAIIIAELEGLIDDVIFKNAKSFIEPISLYRNIGGVFKIAEIREYFTRQLDDAIANKEDYPKKVVPLLNCILSHLEEYEKEIETRKARKTARKVRKKKIVPSKLVKKLKYKKSDSDYNIKSVMKEKIITADVLWVFNTKNRKITQYIASDKVGLMVKGSTIQNYDIEKSQEKTLRKPEEFIDQLMKAGKVEQRTLIDGIKTKSTNPKGRINEHCVLLKVY
jgi:hypothetical protein